MAGPLILMIQTGAGGVARATVRPELPERPERPERPEQPEVAPTAARSSGLGEQIRGSIEQATREVQQELQQEVRNAERHVRDAERQLRDARTPDQRGAARQELMGAQAELQALQSASRGLGGGNAHTVVPADPFSGPQIPPQLVDISVAFAIMVAVIIIGWPLARAFGRRIERRAELPPAPDPMIAGQLQRIEQAVEAMAIEIERISESQRFLTRLQGDAAAERAALGTGERR